MFVDDSPDLERIEEKIRAAITPGNDNYKDIMTALLNVFSFYLGTACPTCRGNIVKWLKQRIPLMVDTANQLAESSGVDERARRSHKHAEWKH
jgi:hypothetical protein